MGDRRQVLSLSLSLSFASICSVTSLPPCCDHVRFLTLFSVLYLLIVTLMGFVLYDFTFFIIRHSLYRVMECILAYIMIRAMQPPFSLLSRKLASADSTGSQAG